MRFQIIVCVQMIFTCLIAPIHLTKAVSSLSRTTPDHDRCIKNLYAVKDEKKRLSTTNFPQFIALQSFGSIEIEDFDDLDLSLIQTFWVGLCHVSQRVCRRGDVSVWGFTQHNDGATVHNFCRKVNKYILTLTSEPSTSSPSSLPTIPTPTSPMMSDKPSTYLPSKLPSALPSTDPSFIPIYRPPTIPNIVPSSVPTNRSSTQPSRTPSIAPTRSSSSVPSPSPSKLLSSQTPSAEPSGLPTSSPNSTPISLPSFNPTSQPSKLLSLTPTTPPSQTPSAEPNSTPSTLPSFNPIYQPSTQPTAFPSIAPTPSPSSHPTSSPSKLPSLGPTTRPSQNPSAMPSGPPTLSPTDIPTPTPSALPTQLRSSIPSFAPSKSRQPSAIPSAMPSKSSSPTSVSQIDVEYFYVLEVDSAKYNENSINEILSNTTHDVVTEALQCENSTDGSVGGRKMILEVQEKESETNIINLLRHQRSKSQKRWQQRNTYIINDSCTLYEFTLRVEAIIFDCFEEPQNLGFQCALISTYISISRIDGSTISNPSVVRESVEKAIEEARENGVIRELFWV